MNGLLHCKRKLAKFGLLFLLSCLAFHCDSDSDLSFSESGGIYNHDIFVDISLNTDSAFSCADSGDNSTIYYTTDGSEPNPYTSDVYSGSIQIAGDGTVMTIIAATFDSDGNKDQYNYERYTIDYSYTGNGDGGDNTIDGIGSAAKFNTPGMITYDGAGNLYVADENNDCIRKVNTATGAVITVAGSTSSYENNDGVGTSAGFENPTGICYYASTLYVGEGILSNQVRKITIPGYNVSTINYGFFDYPTGLVYTGGKLYVVNRFNHDIIAYTPSTVSTVTTAVSSPIGITTDDTNLYVTDSNEIHKIIISSGVISVIAGSLSSGNYDGIGTSAYFDTQAGIAYTNGHLYVADSGNHAIRDIEIYSKAVSILAGSASEVGTADGVGTSARFNSPYGICTDGSYLYVTDSINNNIRKINISTKEVTKLAGAN